MFSIASTTRTPKDQRVHFRAELSHCFGTTKPPLHWGHRFAGVLRAFDEQGDRERGAQLTVSIPFGGARRSAIYAGEVAKASDQQAQAAKVRREILTLAGKDVSAVSSRILAWRAAKAAQEAGLTSARLQHRAYELGEKDLSETLLANGQVYQAMRAEIEARVEAWRAVTKLRLDAHALWADAE